MFSFFFFFFQAEDGIRDDLVTGVQTCALPISEKDLGLIFEPFYRVDAARGHDGTGGEGLGLAIASRAVALHGGHIVARNAEGGGLAVSITLSATSHARSAEQAAVVVA